MCEGKGVYVCEVYWECGACELPDVQGVSCAALSECWHPMSLHHSVLRFPLGYSSAHTSPASSSAAFTVHRTQLPTHNNTHTHAHACMTCLCLSYTACPTHKHTQSEVILRCGLSPYQSALYGIVSAALRAERDKAKAEKAAAGGGGGGGGAGARGLGNGGGGAGGGGGVRGVNNTVMELRCICNHPTLRWVLVGWWCVCWVLGACMLVLCDAHTYTGSGSQPAARATCKRATRSHPFAQQPDAVHLGSCPSSSP